MSERRLRGRRQANGRLRAFSLARALAALPIALLLLLHPGCDDRTNDEPPPPPPPRIVAVGDLHGDLQATRRALRLAGAIDDQDRWIGGALTVVQVGDILDRGGEERAILELFDRLRDEAEAAGGGVHLLNGNHEVLNVALDLRYVTAQGFADFVGAVTVPPDDPQLEGYPPERRPRVVAFRPGGPYARKLADQPFVLQIDGNVFVHGGVRPRDLDYGLAELGEEMRLWMLGEAPRPGWSYGEDNLFWSRDYSRDVDSTDCAALGEVLERMGALRMIVGHTVHDSITSYCDGRVWCIDTGMARYYQGETMVLEIGPQGVRTLRSPPEPPPEPPGRP